MIENNLYARTMTSLADLVTNPQISVRRGGIQYGQRPLDLQAAALNVLAMALNASAQSPYLGVSLDTMVASLEAWTSQDDDAHDTCDWDALVACRNPLHPGPCKGWKHTLHSVSPHIYQQMEAERVRKANDRRLKRIADLKSQGKPIPRKLLAEIKPKPAPSHPAHGAQPMPLGQVNQKADLAGGQAHHAGQAVSKAAGVQVKTAPPLPLGPKGKKPTVSGRGPAFVITQPKVTDTYKLDKAAKITPQEWNDLSAADKKAIRDELEAIKVRGFGPQQKKADELLAKLPAHGIGNGLAPGTPGTVTTPSGKVYQKINPAPGKVSLGQATKTVSPPAAPAAPPAPSAPAASKTPQKFVHTVVHNGVTTTRTSTHEYTHASIVKKGRNGPEVVWGFHKSEANALATPLTSSQKQSGFHVVTALPVKREPLKGKTNTPAAPATPAAPTKLSQIATPNTAVTTGGKPGTNPRSLSPAAQHARAVAGRGIGRPTSKAHVDAYGKLTKDDFDSLDATTQRTIRDDLANAKAKFLDPKKKQDAQDLLDRFGSKHPTPAGGTTGGTTKGYSDPQNEAVKAAQGVGNTDDTLKAVGRLSPDAVKGLDDADRRTVLSRLAFIATHPKATPEQKEKAAAYGRLINGRNTADGTKLPDGTKLDHTASLSQLHAAEKGAGTAAIAKQADAVQAANTPVMSLPGAARDAHVAKMTALSKPEFDALKPDDQRKILTNLQEFHAENSGYQKTHTPASTAAGDAITKYTGHEPAVARARQAEADFRAGRITPRDLHNEVIHAAVQAGVAGSAANRFKAEKKRIAEDNPSLPLWLRSTLIENPYSGKRGNPYDVISQLSMEHMWKSAPRMSLHDFKSLFNSTDADLADSHPIHVEAIKAYREHIVSTGLAANSPWSSATKTQLVDGLTGTGLGGDTFVVNDDHMKMFHELDPATQMKVRTALADRILAQANNHSKAGTDITLRQLQGHPYTGAQLDAATAAADHYGAASKQDKYRKLTVAEFQTLPPYTQAAINSHLDEMQIRAERGSPVAFSPTDNPLKVFPAALKAHLNNTRPAYPDRRERNAADVAQYGTGIVTPESRVETYRAVPVARFRTMSITGQTAIKTDLDKIAADSSNPLELRYQALFTKDFVHGNAHGRINSDQLVAIGATDPLPANRQSDIAVAHSLNALSKSDYDALEPTYREAIDRRIQGLTDPMAAQLLTQKFHPNTPATATPAGVTPTPVQANVPPHVQDALDTIYGVHPKSHTMAHQLTTYGKLRGGDFAQLNPQEQTHLLSDLSFIQTTAKGPSAQKAKLLIDRFTPAGTPSGHIPPQPITVPANAVPGQVRYATPLKGLEKAKDSGQSGDRWITTPGGRRVWGAHGAAGLMIKHTDPNTGEERYLMVQRGPAISDPGKWTFPGGAIDSKETPHQGATRETIEELGLKDDQFKDALVHGDFTYSIPGSTWKYTSVAASVPQMFQPNLSTAHARAETSDAKWMTLAEIKALDKSGDLHHPIAGGLLEKNVISLYPSAGSHATLGQVVRPGPVTRRQGRLHMPSGGRQSPANFNAWPHAHKPSKGKDLIPDKPTFDAMRQTIKNDRKLYDGKTADGRLAAIGAKQGFDDTPTVLDKKEIDRLLATGDYIEAWRGVSGSGGSRGWRSRGSSGGKTAADINEEMRSGPAYYGTGIFGNGYYLATQRRVADQYADGTKGSIVRILIPKSAITQKYDKVSKDSFASSPRASKAKGASYGETSTFWDPGRYAAAKGIDGIEIEPHHVSPSGGARHVAAPGKNAYNWLNRSVLIIQKEPG